MSVLLQLLEADNRQGCVFRCLQAHHRCDAIVVGLFPARCTDAPVVPWFQAWELKSRHRRAQVIALGLAVTEKLLGHHAADAVLAVIRLIGLAKTISIPTSHRIASADFQGLAKNIPWSGRIGAAGSHRSSFDGKSLPKDWHILTTGG